MTLLFTEKTAQLKVGMKYSLVFLVISSFLLRVIPQWDKIFIDGVVLFRGVDSWYHMRLVDNMMHNFPTPMVYDMHNLYPDGALVWFLPLMTWIIAGLGFLWNYEIVGALLPPIVGSLTLIPVYFLGKELFGKVAGFISCMFVAFLPGEFLHRTLLGFTDHHALEVLLMVTTILFLVLMQSRKEFKYVWLAGVSLGLYLLNWHGGLFLVFIIGLWFLAEIYFRNNYELCKRVLYVIVLSFSVTGTLIFMPEVLGIIIISSFILLLFQRYFSKYFSKIFIGLGTVIGILLLINIYGVGEMVLQNMRAVFWGFGSLIEEARPINLEYLIGSYHILSIVSIIGLYFCVKKGLSKLFIIWCIIILLANIGQVRWGYYSIINVSLLSSYIIVSLVEKSKHKLLAPIMITFLLLSPGIRYTIDTVSMSNPITLDWYNSLVWMRNNTLDPFTEGSYYEIHNRSANYGVLSWWDRGHWIVRIARRAPVTSPAYQHGPVSSRFFASETLEESEKILKGHDIRYVIFSSELEHKWKSVLRDSRKDTNIKDSIAYKLWNNELNGWKLVHEEGEVRIFGRG